MLSSTRSSEKIGAAARGSQDSNLESPVLETASLGYVFRSDKPKVGESSTKGWGDQIADSDEATEHLDDAGRHLATPAGARLRDHWKTSWFGRAT